jgi:hypothetical protein
MIGHREVSDRFKREKEVLGIGMGDRGKRRSSRKREKGKKRWFRKRIGTVGGVEVCVWICRGARDEDKMRRKQDLLKRCMSGGEKPVMKTRGSYI